MCSSRGQGEICSGSAVRALRDWGTGQLGLQPTAGMLSSLSRATQRTLLSIKTLVTGTGVPQPEREGASVGGHDVRSLQMCLAGLDPLAARGLSRTSKPHSTTGKGSS
ncbi:hypothetical protein SKAU_G00107070 [Synaphobranchus kaupii]|uniref:Uncharacterized protein n=1 Tax=Synaphobranchus kaupii TaxID=118154 RepID=A0A9Q1G0D6_SYNKA|nr:hypothetical protein SKAU_G00107070 [Synaphobranchus kaupii]